jgi:hypothetical protein
VPFYSRYRNRRAAVQELQVLRRQLRNPHCRDEPTWPCSVFMPFYMPPRMNSQTALADKRHSTSCHYDRDKLGRATKRIVDHGIPDYISRKALLFHSSGMRRSTGIVAIIEDVEEKDGGKFLVIPSGLFRRVRSDMAVGEEDTLAWSQSRMNCDETQFRLQKHRKQLQEQ